MDSEIKVTRETEFYQGFIRFKMSVSNATSFVITDVDLDFRFDDDLLRIDRYEPSSYQNKNGNIILGNIDAGRSKSIAVLFDPLLCSKGTDINCQITYKDAQGRLTSALMESITISVVCPILKTDSDINIGRLKEFIEKLPNRDHKVYEISQGFDIPKLAGIAREVVEKHDVRHIRTLHTKDDREWEIWYYGKTKVQKDDIVIKISIATEKSILELFAATRSAEVLTGLLAEIGRDLKHAIEFRASGKGNIVNVTIKDSIIQRSNLIDLCSIDGTCPANVLVEDSVVQHTNLAPETKKTEEEERKKREEEERQRKQKESEARLKQEMEELRKQREEERLHRENEDLKRKQQEKEQKLRDEVKDKKEGVKQDKLQRQREEEEKARQVQKIKKPVIDFSEMNKGTIIMWTLLSWAFLIILFSLAESSNNDVAPLIGILLTLAAVVKCLYSGKKNLVQIGTGFALGFLLILILVIVGVLIGSMQN